MNALKFIIYLYKEKLFIIKKYKTIIIMKKKHIE
jgi:hypothetical protein